VELVAIELFWILNCQGLLDIHDADLEKSPDPGSREGTLGSETFEASSRDPESRGGLIDCQGVLRKTSRGHLRAFFFSF
jgi:hypothetical protein